MTSLVFDGVLRPLIDDPFRSDAMLPAPTVQSHAANLAILPGGDLACVWFGGTQEGVPDISIWFSRLSTDTWSAPVRLSDDDTRSEQNPVLFNAPDGSVWLLWTAQIAGNQDTSEVRRRISYDGGHSWGPVSTLIPARETGGVFVRQPIVVLDSGRWLLPVFHCVSVPGRRWVGDRDTSAVLISDDTGATWREVAVPDSTGCVHMNIVPLTGGTLAAFYRSRWADFIYRSTSTDDGETWSAPQPIDLPNNNSSIQVIKLADSRLALVFNNSSARDATERRLSLYDEIDDDGLAEQAPPPADFGERTAFWGAPRAPMTLALSDDGGLTWPLLRNLEIGDGYCLTNNSRDGLNREYSYPTVCQTSDGTLDIAFTYFRQTIKHVRVPVDWVQ
ncbi:putative neuraminidase [Kibdelosporangium banguiense]|uniref:Neuraminidase n=1 Tax=Kibdelosporangium banguiense TaxID=1365924 RepID=A0ABS4TZC3_9PSEU|nr:exo-alpha-sialidase [Kibdelosporangium banguiense]MBP2329761.1 putative neuraminidase [Kibdelosporangium banguiense]